MHLLFHTEIKTLSPCGLHQQEKGVFYLNQKTNFQKYKNNVSMMADVENLDGHKLSVKIRQTEKK